METITPKDENVKQKTLILKSDGTTEKLEKEKKKSKVGRILTSREESILLPLIQGLLASGSNGSNQTSEKSKHENTPFPEKENTISPKNEDSGDTCQEGAIKSIHSFDEQTNYKIIYLYSIYEMCFFSFRVKGADGTNILGELLTALNRLQTTIVEEKEVVGDTRKRNTILTLVAWLKRIISTNDTSAASTEGQLTDLLPTELLLTKLMPQLGNDNSNYNKSTNDNEPSDGRLPASSKRFSRQRNNRFNTIGVSKEELADARLYLQKKLLSENLASTATKGSVEIDKQENIFEEREDDRRKSLNFLQSTKLDKSIADLLSNIKGDPKKESIADDTKQVSKVGKIESSKLDREPSIQSRTKVITRRKSSSNPNPIHGQLQGNADQNPTTDSDDDQPTDTQRKCCNGNVGASSKSMNKFALRKLKMKRANTIDIPKNSIEHIDSDHDTLNKISNNIEVNVGDVHLIRNNRHNEADKNHLPEFKIKSSHDRKFQELLNRKNEVTHSSWINPNKCLNQNTKENSRSNWISKFGSIKSSFEYADANVSPRLSKKNSFTHALTSPFKPVQNNKPPQVPNGSYSYHSNNQQVMRKIAAIQSIEHNEPFINLKTPLRTHQSLPNYTNMQNKWNPELNAPNSKLNEWQQNKPSSVDNHISMDSCSPKIMSSSYNPLYVPLNKNIQDETQLSPSPAILPTSSSTNELPSYTYTCTDYTQPTCVSTFGTEKAPIQIKNTILPDTSYLKKQSPKPTPPSLGSAGLSMQMKTFDMHSSSEYLSEPTNYSNYFRSPQPFSPTYMNNYDSQPESQEYTAKSHIMQYPPTQTATVINKAKRFDQQNSFNNLNSIMPSGVHEGRNYCYNDMNSSPFSEKSFSQLNRTYMLPEEMPQNRISKQANNVVSMEHSPTRYETEHSMPIRLRNNKLQYGSDAALTINRGSQINEFIPREIIPNFVPVEDIKSKVAAPVKLNSYGGHYIQPKVESNFDKSFPKFGKGSTNNNVRSNISHVSRSQTNTLHRLSNMEIKRKQSLPAQGSDYFDKVCNQNESDLPPTHSYLPSGVLKRSKSTHTLALLQQFENKGKSHDNEHKTTLPSYVRKPSFDRPSNIDVKHSSVIRNRIDFENKTKSISSQQEASTKREFEEISTIPKTRTDFSESSRNTISSDQNPKTEQSPINNKTEFKESFLNAPTMNEVPSPSVEDGHIIYPGQTNQTKNRVQHYAQTLNAILNRKSIILDDDDTDSDKNDPTSVKNQVIQKSKSVSLLCVPKQYESAIKRSEVEEKQRTVASYFLANKSPSQNLQRSSSQHSVLSSSSFKSARDNSIAASPHHLDELEKSAKSTETAESRSTSTTTTTTTTTNKSAHHLKILRKQQKTTSNTPLAKSQTLPSINLLDESNVDDAFDDLFASFNAKI